jgi:F-type H+-transporting ATPase subunit b
VPQLDPTWFVSQLFWLAVTFTLLYIALSRVVLPPLMSVIGARKGAVADDLETAQRYKAEAEAAKTAYEHTLLQAREMAQALLNESEAASKARTAETMKVMDQKLAERLADAGQALAKKKQQLMNDLTPVAVELSSLIVEKITKRAPQESDVKRTLETVSKTPSAQ